MSNPNPVNPYQTLRRAYSRALYPRTVPAGFYYEKDRFPRLANAIHTAAQIGYKTEVYLDGDGDIGVRHVEIVTREAAW